MRVACIDVVSDEKCDAVAGPDDTDMDLWQSTPCSTCHEANVDMLYQSDVGWHEGHPRAVAYNPYEDSAGRYNLEQEQRGWWNQCHQAQDCTGPYMQHEAQGWWNACQQGQVHMMVIPVCIVPMVPSTTVESNSWNSFSSPHLERIRTFDSFGDDFQSPTPETLGGRFWNGSPCQTSSATASASADSGRMRTVDQCWAAVEAQYEEDADPFFLSH
mmetsp:Transcript_46277/g.100619  ORF Transcript_46277/g.100619 Transcript_46277/m.100619 type:complete len:215 (-) Transcript_46277:348-992(-)